MALNRSELGWAVAGNIVVGVGAGTSTLAAFAPRLPLVADPHPAVRVSIVSIGFAVFFAGYGLSQAGTHRDPESSLVDELRPDVGTAGNVTGFDVVRGVSLLLGVVVLGGGMRLFALTIQFWDPTLGLLTGVVCIAGYIFGHIGINGVIL